MERLGFQYTAPDQHTLTRAYWEGLAAAWIEATAGAPAEPPLSDSDITDTERQHQ